MEIFGLVSDRISSKERCLTYKCFDLDDRSTRMRVKYSSINYKDQLLVDGAAHVTRLKSIVPGIDCVGELDGRNFVCAGFNLGVSQHGGWAEYCAVSRDQIIEIPRGLTAESCAAYGTAGLTAAEVVSRICESTQDSDSPHVLVIGGSRGASLLTVIFLAGMGYRVTLASRTEISVFSHSDVFSYIGLNDLLSPKLATLGNTETKFDVVVDFLGGVSVPRGLSRLVTGGEFLSVGNVLGNTVDAFSLAPFFLNGVQMRGVNLESLSLERKKSLWSFIADNQYRWSSEFSWQTVQFMELKGYLDDQSGLENASRVVIKVEG